jgi:hypothetical protein
VELAPKGAAQIKSLLFVITMMMKGRKQNKHPIRHQSHEGLDSNGLSKMQ